MSQVNKPVDLLDLDDNFGAPRLTEIKVTDLAENFSIDPDDYEPAWNALNEGYPLNHRNY